MTHTRDVWRIDRAGSLDRLVRRTEPLRSCTGEARVSVKAIGLNFADIFACLGLYSATPTDSFVPGLEFAGIVEGVCPEPGVAALFAPGDRVVGLTRFGGFATALNSGSQYLRPVRAGWSFAQAASYPVQGLTAWYGLVRLGAVTRGHIVLLQSAAGGVGLNALAILDAVGARVVATVGQEAKRRWLIDRRGLQPEQVVVRDRRRFGAQLDRSLAATGASGFDVVFDAVAGPFLRPAYERLRPQGRLVVYGAADYMSRGSRVNYLGLVGRYLSRARFDPLSMISENRSVMGFNLIWLWDQVQHLPVAWDALDALITRPPVVGREFPFAAAPAALRCLQRGETIGKVVLTA